MLRTRQCIRRNRILQTRLLCFTLLFFLATPVHGQSAQSTVEINPEDATLEQLDTRIAELENLLALRREEAERVRLERLQAEARLDELENEIAVAQEIVLLQDLQLAQLQQSLAEAAAQSAQAAAAAAQQMPDASSPLVTQAQPSGLLSLWGNAIDLFSGNLLSAMAASLTAVGGVFITYFNFRRRGKLTEAELELKAKESRLKDQELINRRLEADKLRAEIANLRKA